MHEDFYEPPYQLDPDAEEQRQDFIRAGIRYNPARLEYSHLAHLIRTPATRSDDLYGRRLREAIQQELIEIESDWEEVSEFYDDYGPRPSHVLEPTNPQTLAACRLVYSGLLRQISRSNPIEQNRAYAAAGLDALVTLIPGGRWRPIAEPQKPFDPNDYPQCTCDEHYNRYCPAVFHDAY